MLIFLYVYNKLFFFLWLISLFLLFFQTYQVYAMRSAEDVYKILTSQKTNYVIIEESICNKLSLNKGCRIKDLLDIANGHVSYSFTSSHQAADSHQSATKHTDILHHDFMYFWSWC